MDVSPYSTELQALVLRAVLDQVQDTEEHVIVVVPEAWEFLPENRGSPVKAAAERLVRKGATLGTISGSTARTSAACGRRSCARAGGAHRRPARGERD